MTETLRHLQQSFQVHVLQGDPGMTAHISHNVLPSAEARLAIYSNGYRLRLLEALRTDFPALHTLAGDDYFEQIGRRYIEACPSRHFSIRYFGQHLSRFLAETTPFMETLALSEMARLEWALTLAFDSADDPVLDESALTALPPEAWSTLRLHFHTSVQREDFYWNVPELWTAIDQQRPAEPPQTYPEPRAWLIWRREYQNYFRSLDDNEAWALNYLRAGHDFGSLCEGLCERAGPSQVGMLAAGFLKNWTRAGLISHLD